MIGDKRVLAVIPARAGSRRLPGKNTLPLAGKPLIQWTIEAARACPEIDDIAVTTDDPEVAAIAAALHVEVIDRPPHMATDAAPTAPALLHALTTMEEWHGLTFDLVVLLQPTSPLRRPAHISAALHWLAVAGVPSVATVHLDGKLNGAVYASWRYVALGGNVLADAYDRLTMGSFASIDIDTAEDFARAEALVANHVI